MTGIGKFLRKIWSSISNLFHNVEDEIKKLIPIAIDVVQGIKVVMESPVVNVLEAIVKSAIPGDADDKLIEKIDTTIREWIPKVLLELNMVDAIANMDNIDDQLNAILAKLKLSSDETKNIFYHGLASLILEKLSDGKFDWTDAVAVSEYYYAHILKPTQETTTQN